MFQATHGNTLQEWVLDLDAFPVIRDYTLQEQVLDLDVFQVIRDYTLQEQVLDPVRSGRVPVPRDYTLQEQLWGHVEDLLKTTTVSQTPD